MPEPEDARPGEETGPPLSFEDPYDDEEFSADGSGPSDPGGSPEDEGIPDLQDGTPQQQGANDPQQQPVPGDTATAVSRSAPTPAEMREGESLDERLAEEEPDIAPVATGDSGPGEEAGRLREGTERLPPRHQDVHARERGGDALSAEEEAVRVEEADQEQET